MKQHYTKQFTLQNSAKLLDLEITREHTGKSFALDCNFYKTKYENIFITDYDILNDDDLEKKSLSMFICNHVKIGNTLLISNDILNDKTEFNKVLDFFKNKQL